MLLRVFKISGHSMMPTLSPDEKVVISSIPYLFFQPKIGDLVVFKYKSKFMIKKITKIENGLFEVFGENKNDSLIVSKLQREEILGKVIWKI